MATRAYGVPPGKQQGGIVEFVGSATSSAAIVLTVDLATTAVTEGGTTRGVKLSEVLEALENARNYLIKGNWPPA